MGEGDQANVASADGRSAADLPSHRHRRLWIAFAVLVLATAAYFVFFQIFAYTEDAYVWSDLVTVAAQVDGPVASVAIHDNQPIEPGDLVATLDPRPYQLDVDLKTRTVANLEAVVAVKREADAANAAHVDAAKGALVYAQAEYDRISVLAREQNVAQAELDRATDALRTAKDRLADRQANALVSRREVDVALTAAAVAKANLAVADYDLARTRLTAPAKGYVNNLNLRPGDYARAGDALVGIVDATRWRIIANFKEDVAAKLAEGTRVWIWLDSDPWHLRTGKVQGVGRGIARSPTSERLLPYVAPTTDWIRLRRRLPVTIFLDAPLPLDKLFMGTDARVFLVR